MQPPQPPPTQQQPQPRLSEEQIQQLHHYLSALPPRRSRSARAAIVAAIAVAVIALAVGAGCLSARYFSNEGDTIEPGIEEATTVAGGGSLQEGTDDSAAGGSLQEGTDDSAAGGSLQEGTDDSAAGGSLQEGTDDSAAGPFYFPYIPADYGSGPCAPIERVEAPVLDFAGPPGVCIDLNAVYEAVIDTSKGRVVVALDVANAPGTVNSFVNLARFGYYDGTLIHRSDPSIGILQGGSPHTNDASDPGPGYGLWDEGVGFTYRPGQLVMARSTGPDSGDAQFFFTVTKNAALLNGEGTYIVFGDVTEGLDVLENILNSHQNDPESDLGGAPDPSVTIETITVIG